MLIGGSSRVEAECEAVSGLRSSVTASRASEKSRDGRGWAIQVAALHQSIDELEDSL
jgi:hypothetical protein